MRIECDFGEMPSGFKEKPERPFETEEINLLYVALTRARRGLEISSALGDLLSGAPDAQKAPLQPQQASEGAQVLTTPPHPSRIRQGASRDSFLVAGGEPQTSGKGREAHAKAAPRRKARAEETAS